MRVKLTLMYRPGFATGRAAGQTLTRIGCDAVQVWPRFLETSTPARGAFLPLQADGAASKGRFQPPDKRAK